VSITSSCLVCCLVNTTPRQCGNDEFVCLTNSMEIPMNYTHKVIVNLNGKTIGFLSMYDGQTISISTNNSVSSDYLTNTLENIWFALKHGATYLVTDNDNQVCEKAILEIGDDPKLTLRLTNLHYVDSQAVGAIPGFDKFAAVREQARQLHRSSGLVHEARLLQARGLKLTPEHEKALVARNAALDLYKSV